jgi:hypothetical protein
MRIGKASIFGLAAIALCSGIAQARTKGSVSSPSLLRAVHAACGPATTRVYDATMSPDGRSIAFVRAGRDRSDPSSLWLVDQRDRTCKLLLQSHPTDDNKTNLRALNHPLFSPTGGELYVLSQAWVTSDALFRVDLAAGKHRFVSAANLAMILRNGPYKGDLVISEHAYNAGPEGGSFEQLVLIRPDGHRIMVLPAPNDGK